MRCAERRESEPAQHDGMARAGVTRTRAAPTPDPARPAHRQRQPTRTCTARAGPAASAVARRRPRRRGRDLTAPRAGSRRYTEKTRRCPRANRSRESRAHCRQHNAKASQSRARKGRATARRKSSTRRDLRDLDRHIRTASYSEGAAVGGRPRPRSGLSGRQRTLARALATLSSRNRDAAVGGERRSSSSTPRRSSRTARYSVKQREVVVDHLRDPTAPTSARGRPGSRRGASRRPAARERSAVGQVQSSRR